MSWPTIPRAGEAQFFTKCASHIPWRVYFFKYDARATSLANVQNRALALSIRSQSILQLMYQKLCLSTFTRHTRISRECATTNQHQDCTQVNLTRAVKSNYSPPWNPARMPAMATGPLKHPASSRCWTPRTDLAPALLRLGRCRRGHGHGLAVYECNIHENTDRPAGRQPDRQADKQADRQTGRQIGTDGQIDGQTDRQRQRDGHRQTDRQEAERETERRTETEGEPERQRDRGRETDRQTDNA